MLAATATNGDIARGAGDAAAASGLVALARKLQHPLGRIRERALANLLFKLREKLVDVAREPTVAVDDLAHALVDCLTIKELEMSALQAVQLLLDADVACVCAPPLRHHGAAAALQRGAALHQERPDVQASYEALLHRLLATSSAAEEAVTAAATLPSRPERQISPPAAARSASAVQDRVSPAVRVAEATLSVATSRRASSKHSDPLTTCGWKFPRVALAAVDEHFLFEFEVKWRLRTSIPDIVEMTDTFRRQLLRDFPAEMFLQRPAMLLRVLELVREPIVPAATTPELSFGVNYFDESASGASFAWKPSVLATALHVSSLKALESWLAAMRHSMQVSLNPMYHTFQPAVSPSALAHSSPGYDHKRLYYPRTIQDDEDASQEEDSLSLGGAAYLLLATLLRLLSSDTYPHFHLLNVIHTATNLLSERSVSLREGTRSLNPLDKQRIESLFIIVADVLRVQENSQLASQDVIVQTRLLDWVVRVLQLQEPSCFRVDGSLGEHGEASIDIPASLWAWLLRAVATRSGDPREEMGDGATIEYLTKIDFSVRSKLAQMRKLTEENVHLSAALHTFTENCGSQTPYRLQVSLAAQIVQVLPTLTETERSMAGGAVLKAICDQLDEDELASQNESARTSINHMMIQLVTMAIHENPHYCREVSTRILDGLVDWALNDNINGSRTKRVRSLVSVTTLSGEFFQILMCSLTGTVGEDEVFDTLWRVAEMLLQSLEQLLGDQEFRHALEGLSESLPLLQHFAYVDPSLQDLPGHHRRLQRTFMQLVHQMESTLSDGEQLLLVSRCLVHRSAFIRKAASSGLRDRLDKLSVQHQRSLLPATSDPFGFYAESTGGRALDGEFPSLLYPRHASGTVNSNVQGAGNGSSALHGVSRLRKLVSSLVMTVDGKSDTARAACSALHQLFIDVVHACCEDFTLLEESGEIEELGGLCINELSRHEESGGKVDVELRRTWVAIARAIMTRSTSWRQKIRHDERSLACLLSRVFDEDSRVRAEMYFMVVILTCSLEVVVPCKAISEVVVPSDFRSTFGLFAERWPVAGVSTRSILGCLREDAPIREASDYTSETLDSKTSTLSTSFSALWDALPAAKSYRTYLDALYNLIHGCHACVALRRWASDRWEEASFRQYLETAPTSAKDKVIMSASLALANVLFDCMPTDQQMDVVLLLRRSVIPLVLAQDRNSSRSTTLATQLVCMLLRVSKSNLDGMFLSLVVDTGMTKRLGELIGASGVATPSPSFQQALWIQVALAALEHARRADEPTYEQHIVDAITMPLEAIAGRHHVPGSFDERSAYVQAVACLSSVEACEGDGHWQSRLLFDCTAGLRSVGFQAAVSTLERERDGEHKRRILRLALDTMREETECDAVRSSAAELLFRFFERAERDELLEFASSVEAEKFSAALIRDLASASVTREKCSVRVNLVRSQLLRLFVCRQGVLGQVPMESVPHILLNFRADDGRALSGIVVLLSLRQAFESYQHHGIAFLRMQSVGNDVWIQSILPVAVRTIIETARLLQMLLQHPSLHVSTAILATTLVLQLIETITDVSASLKELKHSEADEVLIQGHYEALDESGKLLSILLTLGPTPAVSVQSSTQLMRAIVYLLEPSHSKKFRLSFSRVVAAIMCHPPGTLSDVGSQPSYALPLGSSLWATYRDLCDQQPMDPTTSTARVASYTPHLRRIGVALQALLARSPEVCTQLCGDQHRAVQHVVRTVKLTFAAIRMTGGFGGKTVKGANDSFLVELATIIQLHCHVLSGFLAVSSEAQNLARHEKLSSTLADNWNTMRVAYRRGSDILLGALRLTQNYVHRNDANKTSLSSTVSTIAISRTASNAGPDGERILLSLIGELSLGQSQAGGASFDERWSSVAGAILKSAFLHVDCLHGSIKTGLVNKLFASVVERSKRHRQSAKPLSLQEEQTLVELVGVLASVGSSDDGRQVILQQRELKDLLDDVFHFAEGSELLVVGSLFVRNMAFSKFSKSHFSIWEPVLDRTLAILHRWGDASQTSDCNLRLMLTACHLSTALVCFVFDNQRAQSVLQRSGTSMLLLQDAARSWSRLAETQDMNRGDRSRQATTVSSNLTRVQSLLANDEPADTEATRP